MTRNLSPSGLAILQARMAANRNTPLEKHDKSKDEEVEARLQRAAHDYMDAEGIYYHHDRNRRRDDPGVPDDLICHQGFVAAEAKSKRGKPSPEQLQHMARIRKSGGRVFVFRSLNEFIRKLNGKVNEANPR